MTNADNTTKIGKHLASLVEVLNLTHQEEVFASSILRSVWNEARQEGYDRGYGCGCESGRELAQETVEERNKPDGNYWQESRGY